MILEVHTYHTAGGKDVIRTYLDGLNESDRLHGYTILYRLETNGMKALYAMNTRLITGKIWEIKFSRHRLFYVLADRDHLYLLHACLKQKNKTEKKDLDIAIQRAKDL